MNKEAVSTYRLEDIGLYLPEILIPADNVDYNKWSVVACDQFTSQPEYWESVERYVGDNPSALRIILPEAYLDSRRSEDSATQKEYTAKISGNMAKYLKDNTLRNIGRCAVFTERTLASGKKRNGLVLAIDLEKYDYAPTSVALIRPSEYTVPERLPPRVAIRREALIEAPHTILLFNDKKGEAFRHFEEAIVPSTSLASPASLSPASLIPQAPVDKLYDFDLMMDGGHLKGYRFDAKEHEALFEQFTSDLLQCSSHSAPSSHSALSSLSTPSSSLSAVQPDLVFTVGDGNHSLAAAKLLWEELKSAGAGMDHPARYSLVELENSHDDSIAFESIHRAVFGIPAKQLVTLMQKYAPAPYIMEPIFNEEGMDEFNKGSEKADHGHTAIPFKSLKHKGFININTPFPGIAIYVLQKSIESVLAAFSGNVPEITPVNTPGYTPGNVPEITPVNTPGYTPGNVPEIKPGYTPGNVPEITLVNTPGYTPNNTPGYTPGNVPGITPGITPGNVPEITPEITPGYTPNNTPGYTPGNVPGYTLGNVPEITPVNTPGYTPNSVPGYTEGGAGIRIDYVHGADALEAVIGSREDATGFYMPEISKDGFFDTISKAGRFPLKSFSIGQAKEKRYYLECRKIIPQESS